MIAADLFAGWGGMTEGATRAGARVVYAANHWPLAVEAHAANHPGAHHECQDLRQADFRALPDIDLLLAAPACQGHSRASQSKRRAYHDALRSTAWAVIDCCDLKEPRVVLVENVPEFLGWRLYPAWKLALESMGYAVSENILLASRLGVPQRRRRLFVVATRSRAPLVLRLDEAEDEPPFGPCIDWHLGSWRPVASKSAAVQARVARGRERLGYQFLTQHVTNHPGVGLDEPIRTITTKDQWAVVDGDRMRPLTARENLRGMGFPESYRVPARATRKDMIRGVGNAVCPPKAERAVRFIRAHA